MLFHSHTHLWSPDPCPRLISKVFLSPWTCGLILPPSWQHSEEQRLQGLYRTIFNTAHSSTRRSVTEWLHDLGKLLSPILLSILWFLIYKKEITIAVSASLGCNVMNISEITSMKLLERYLQNHSTSASFYKATMFTVSVTITASSYLLRVKAFDFIWRLFFPLQRFSASILTLHTLSYFRGKKKILYLC